MTSKDGIEILKSAWHDRMDKPNYPNFDDINEALTSVEKDLKILDILKSKFSKTEYGNYWIDEIFWKENYPGYEKHNEEFELIKEWLEEK